MAKKSIEKILLPKELTKDEIISLAVIYKYGKESLSGLSKAKLEFRASLPEGKTLDYYLRKGVLPLFLLSPTYKSVLEQLVNNEEFSGANRIGCALLYLGQMDDIENVEQYLLKAQKEYADSWYGDGVNVGAYSTYRLFYYYTYIC